MKRTRPLLLTSRLLRPLFHVGLILGSFYMVILLRAHTDLIPGIQLRIPPIDMRETMLFSGGIGITFVVIGAISGLYALFAPVQHYYKTFIRVWLLWLMISACIAYVGFGYVFVNGISRFVLIIGALVFFVLSTFIDLAINAFQYLLERKQPYKVLLYSGDTPLTKKIQELLLGYKIYEIVRQDASPHAQIEDIYDIVIVAGKIGLPLLQSIADSTRIQGQRLYHIGNELYLEDLIATPQRLGPLIALAYSSSPLQGRWRVVKRLIDIFASFFGLLMLSPFFICIGILLLLDSSGPVLYKQTRVGKNKKEFTFIKFRTMYTHMSVGAAYGGDTAEQMYSELIHSEKNVRDTILPKIEDDPRVTRIGRFLRKTSIDELPSLWSVLVGDMSLVGPRPHMPSEVDRYDARQERLFSLKPGITGYAQIFGRDQLPFEEEAKLDLYYIQNRSVGLDIYVLINTIRVVFSGR